MLAGRGSDRIRPPGPLNGVRVLDLTRLLPGPAATRQLADMGADVLKIETVDGDPARRMGPLLGDTTPVFLALNRHKRFVTLDLKQKDDRARFLDWVSDADVVVESFRPGTMARLDIGWERLSALNPKLVLCSLSGFGQTGELAARAGHDINYLALSGVLEQNADATGRPVLPGFPIADIVGAQAAVGAILAALLDARASGRGQQVDVSLTDAVFAQHVFAEADVNLSGQSPPPGSGLLTGGAPCYNVYRCIDERYLAVGALEYPFWRILCTALSRPDLVARHWSRGEVPGSAEAAETHEILCALFAARPLAEWCALLEPLDCCVSPVLRMDEAMRHPLFAARGMVVAQERADPGLQMHIAPPMRFGKSAFEVARGAMQIGADDNEA